MLALIRLGRLHFLVGGVLMFALGSVVADRIDIVSYAIGQSMVVFGQVTAHYANEYADAEADRGVTNRTWFSGGSGVIAGGLVPRSVALHAAIATSLLTVACGLGLVALGRPVAAVMGAFALVISWVYSIPPLRLLATGWGEAATTLVVVVLVPSIGAAAQGTWPTPGLAWAMAALIPAHLAMMLVFEIPDLEADARSGKTVLAARLGRRATLRTIGVLYALAATTLTAAVGVGALPDRALAGLAFAVPAAGSIVALSAVRYQASGAASILVVGTIGIAAIGGLAA